MAVDPAPTGTPLYAFEKIRGRADAHRDPKAARAALEVLWSRLEGETEQLAALERGDPGGWELLLRYATDGPLAVEWYEDRRPELEAKQRRYNALVMGVVIVVFGLAFLLPFQPLVLIFLGSELKLDGGPSSTGLIDVAALLGVLVSGTTIALRLSSVGVRYRKQAAVFHKASAALKEQLYRLETEWRGKPLVHATDDAGPRLHPALDEAVRRAVGQAQAIMADERDAYFDTLTMDVNALTDGAGGVAEAMTARAVFRVDGRSEHSRQHRELDEQLAKARLRRDTLTAKIAVLERELTAPEADRSGLQRMILEHRLSLQESEQELQQLEASLRSLRG